MTELRFPSPAAFAQSVRMRRSASSPGTLFLIVEGSSDRKTFHALLNPHLHYVPSRGKEMVLGAFDLLSAEGVSDCMFVVDCDGGTESRWLGRDGLVISANRDVDADLLLTLRAFDRVALEYLSDVGNTAEECVSAANSVMRFATALTASFGIILDGARSLGMSVKVVDLLTGKRRRLRLNDLGEIHGWVRDLSAPDSGSLLQVVASVLSWKDDQRSTLAAHLATGAEKPCRLHRATRCTQCTPRRFSNGHDLADVLALALTQRCGFEVKPAEFARAARLAASKEAATNWDVGVRILRWQKSRSASEKSTSDVSGSYVAVESSHRP